LGCDLYPERSRMRHWRARPNRSCPVN
jgi:hypothetical protein